MSVTKKDEEKLKDIAISMVAQGRSGILGIYRDQNNNNLYVTTKKMREFIVKFNITVRCRDKFYSWNETNFNQQLVLGKGDNDENPAWFVLCDNDWNYISSSQEDNIDFQMILFAQPRKRLPYEGRDQNAEKNKNVPISINARFSSMGNDSKFAVVVVAQDQNIGKLWQYEADNIVEFTVNKEKEEQYGQPQFSY